MKNELITEFKRRFQKEPEAVYFCPGRINLIGEHIDYNGGKVLPCAIDNGTYLAVGKNTEKKLNFESLNFPETVNLNLQEGYSKTGKAWYNYPLGVIHHLLEEGHGISGLDMLYSGNLAIGAGLSSSASIEVLTVFALNDLFALDISRKDMVLLSKKVENEFIGVNSGIMDQFAVAFGKTNHAILLNCDTLDSEYIPIELGEYILVIMNSNKSRKLEDSKYNERFLQCGQALTALKKVLPVRNLCDIRPDEFLLHKQVIGDPVLEKRALHVIFENDRVKKAVTALKNNDLAAFGKLMFESHESLDELYEVSGEELDTLVAFGRSYDGCIGARMTGAGFGGCAIALVKRELADDFAAKLTADYEEKIGYAPDVFVTGICGGVTQLKS